MLDPVPSAPGTVAAITSGTINGATLGITTPAAAKVTTLAVTTSQTMASGTNLVLDTVTGTKIGTGATQLLGLWNAAPVVQPSGATQVAPASYSTGAFGLDSDAHMHALYDLVVAMRTALVAAGIMKGSA